MFRTFLTLALLTIGCSAAAQEDVSAMLNRALRESGCGMTDEEARAYFDAAGAPWSEVLDAVRDLSQSGYVLVSPDGTYIGIDPLSCHPTPIYVPDTSPGPRAADWLTARLAQEHLCRLPIEALRSEALAAGVDPERLEDVLGSWSDIGRLDDETGEMKFEPAYCAHLQDPEDWEVLAISNEGRHTIRHAIAGVLRARGCRMPDDDATMQEIRASLVETLELDRLEEGLSPLATAVLEAEIRKAITEENRYVAVDPATGDWVAAECEPSR